MLGSRIEMMGRGIKKVLDDLRAVRILVLHPRDDDGDALIRQLRRIGCDVRAAWPIPDEVPKASIWFSCSSNMPDRKHFPGPREATGR